MKKLTNSPKSTVFIVLFFLMTSVGFSQIPIPNSGGGNDDVQDEAPISSLVALGLIVGTAFGIKKLKK